MARLYTQYMNNGKTGFTWAALVATVMGALGNEDMTTYEITREIWGRSGPAPETLHSQVQTALYKLIENKFALRIKKGGTYRYGLTAKGFQEFDPHTDTFHAASHTDSKLFQPKERKVKKTSKSRYRKAA